MCVQFPMTPSLTIFARKPFSLKASLFRVFCQKPEMISLDSKSSWSLSSERIDHTSLLFFPILWYFIKDALSITYRIFKNDSNTFWCFLFDFLFSSVLFLSFIFSLISASSTFIVFNLLFLFLAHIQSYMKISLNNWKRFLVKFLFLWAGSFLLYLLLSFLLVVNISIPCTVYNLSLKRKSNMRGSRVWGVRLIWGR